MRIRASAPLLPLLVACASSSTRSESPEPAPTEPAVQEPASKAAPATNEIPTTFSSAVTFDENHVGPITVDTTWDPTAIAQLGTADVSVNEGERFDAGEIVGSMFEVVYASTPILEVLKLDEVAKSGDEITVIEIRWTDVSSASGPQGLKPGMTLGELRALGTVECKQGIMIFDAVGCTLDSAPYLVFDVGRKFTPDAVPDDQQVSSIYWLGPNHRGS